MSRVRLPPSGVTFCSSWNKYYLGSRYSYRISIVMLVWNCCFCGPWLFHKMILLDFYLVCALLGFPATFINVRSAMCSVNTDCTVACSTHSALFTRTCTGRGGAFSTANKSVSFIIAFNYLQIGMQASNCCVHYSSLLGTQWSINVRVVNVYWGRKYIYAHSHIDGHPFTCLTNESDLTQKNNCNAYVHTANV